MEERGNSRARGRDSGACLSEKGGEGRWRVSRKEARGTCLYRCRRSGAPGAISRSRRSRVAGGMITRLTIDSVSRSSARRIEIQGARDRAVSHEGSQNAQPRLSYAQSIHRGHALATTALNRDRMCHGRHGTMEIVLGRTRVLGVFPQMFWQWVGGEACGARV